jgi:hypothetical protein
VKKDHKFVKSDIVIHPDGWQGEITNISASGRLGFVGRWVSLDDLEFCYNADEADEEAGRKSTGSLPSTPHENSTIDHESITALLSWRDSSTDHYGDDLIALLMAEFSSDPYTLHHNRKDIPGEYLKGLEEIKKLSYDDQHKIIEAFVEKQ